MREIKFRGKRIDTGEWVYGYYFKTPLTQENIDCEPKDGWFFICGKERHCISCDGVVYEVDQKTIGQFTGLNDKNGKEIYKSDLIKNSFGRICEVVWNEYCGMWDATVVNFSGQGGNIGFKTQEWGTCVEKIGNIHESKYLLEN